MDIIISNADNSPIYEQIYRQIKSGILRGSLQEGDMLPSIRALAKDLRISVITTKRAYDELEKDGYIHTVAGKGCFVAEKGKVTRVPACPVEPPIDFVGAGDTFLSGFGTMLCAGADSLTAAWAANLCSAVTIRKLGVTGTATRQELLDAWQLYFG